MDFRHVWIWDSTWPRVIIGCGVIGVYYVRIKWGVVWAEGVGGFWAHSSVILYFSFLFLMIYSLLL